jgi:hypothetical protein
MLNRHTKPRGQALVEFAIVSIVLLLIFFILIEVGRVLWAWVTVQNAARQGSRYAITGQFDPACMNDPIPCEDPRLASIQERAIERMTGLRLNLEADRVYEDDYALFVEVYGINEFGELQPDFAGLPSQPMVVRIIYNVPIITPILSNIVTNVPVMGQVVRNNEPFGQTGSIAQGQAPAPILPPVPTAGPSPTPTPTPTPTSTASATPGPSPTATNTLTPLPTNTPDRCNVRFEQELVQLSSQVDITSDVNDRVTITDLTTGIVLATDVLIEDFSGHLCEGFKVVNVAPPLQAGHVIVVESTNGTFDVATVQEGTNTPTPIPTQTLAPTLTPTIPVATLTPTPTGPYVILNPVCTNGNIFQGNLQGFNWTTAVVNISWNGAIKAQLTPSGGIFQLPISGENAQAINVVTISNGTTTINVQVNKPCPNVTSTPTVEAATSTPSPADLIVVGTPVMVSPLVTPIGYQPVTFQVEVTNAGDFPVSSAFFIDVFLNPPAQYVEPGSEFIPVNLSSGFTALSSLAPGASRVVTITSELGFPNPPNNQGFAYAMVDSLRAISEAAEDNNISDPLNVYVIPGATPTPSPTPVGGGTQDISGIVWNLYTRWFQQGRARVYLVSVKSNVPRVEAQIFSSLGSGAYLFENVPTLPGGDYYRVVSCFDIDGETRMGARSNLQPGAEFISVYLIASPTGCQPLNP